VNEFRERLLALSSLNDIRSLRRELAARELLEAAPLPFFVVASILSEICECLDRPLDPGTWDQVRERVRDPMEGAIQATTGGDEASQYRALNLLVRRWAQVRQELA
jgi:hypothetical protein